MRNHQFLPAFILNPPFPAFFCIQGLFLCLYSSAAFFSVSHLRMFVYFLVCLFCRLWFAPLDESQHTCCPCWQQESMNSFFQSVYTFAALCSNIHLFCASCLLVLVFFCSSPFRVRCPASVMQAAGVSDRIQ